MSVWTQSRIDVTKASTEAYQAVVGLETYCRRNVDGTLLELIKMRASIVNGCAFCVDMHSRDATAAGEDPRRLFAVAAWHEAPFFTTAERAALALTDAVTRLGEHGVPDDTWDAAVAEFGERGTVDILMAIATINVWNRLAIATRLAPPLTV